MPLTQSPMLGFSLFPADVDPDEAEMAMNTDLIEGDGEAACFYAALCSDQPWELSQNLVVQVPYYPLVRRLRAESRPRIRS